MTTNYDLSLLLLKNRKHKIIFSQKFLFLGLFTSFGEVLILLFVISNKLQLIKIKTVSFESLKILILKSTIFIGPRNNLPYMLTDVMNVNNKNIIE